MKKVNEFVNNNNLKDTFGKLDRMMFLETAHMSDFYGVLNNRNYKTVLKNIDDFLPFIIEKIINNEYRFVHILLILEIVNIDRDNFRDSTLSWWEENKHKYGK
jgi:hypothetical protein